MSPWDSPVLLFSTGQCCIAPSEAHTATVFATVVTDSCTSQPGMVLKSTIYCEVALSCYLTNKTSRASSKAHLFLNQLAGVWGQKIAQIL